MRFLIAAMRKNQRRVRVEQWLLLAVRTLIILLVVLAMAKPFLESAGRGRPLPGPEAALGAGARRVDEHGRPRRTTSPGSTRRKDIARRLVKDARQGDAFERRPDGRPAPGGHRQGPAFNKDEVLKTEIDALTLPHGGTDLAATFARWTRCWAPATLPSKEVVFLTDLQAASWRRPGSEGGRRA